MIRGRLDEETKLEYTESAVVRGLMSLALASLVGLETLAEQFPAARLVRGNNRCMVVRVPWTLPMEVEVIVGRLEDEGRRNYPAVAVARGLISLGLATLNSETSLTQAFAGAYVPRGRRPRSKVRRDVHTNEDHELKVQALETS